MEFTTILDAVERAKAMVSSEAYAEVMQNYRMADFSISEMGHRKLTASAVKLFNVVMTNANSRADDCSIAALYLLVCVDCMKHKLDVVRFEMDSGIPSMRLKCLLTK